MRNHRSLKLKLIYFLLLAYFLQATYAQEKGVIQGVITSNGTVLEFASVGLKGTTNGTTTNAKGYYELKDIPFGTYNIEASCIGYEKQTKKITLSANQTPLILAFDLKESGTYLNEVVISGTMKEVTKSESPVSIEVYSAQFFKTNPTPTIFEAMQTVNGVRPQLNCNVCNTGDIKINGLEGPYTMVLIDGMPLVSGLSTVYGLSGIPTSLIERLEIVKGPASTLYGSEAVGGVINVITKKSNQAPIVAADVFSTSWGEVNTDLATKFSPSKKVQALVGVNYFNFQQRIDKNKDGFTDMTLQNRLSVFNKWTIERKDNRVFTLAGRYVNESRWGGDMRWRESFRGGDSIYGESIDTKRWELFGAYQLPVKEKIMFQLSANGHHQNSYYGNIPYLANQKILFGQLTWHKELGRKNDLLFGLATRYTFYDDNTPATATFDTLTTPKNKPSRTYLPGLFIQDEIKLNENNKLLVGVRYDYNSIHGSIFSPRLNYKLSSRNKKNSWRIGLGNGYRVANIFTEDHAALTGARTVTFLTNLKPETSYNGSLNFVKKIEAKKNTFINLDASAWYTYFTNKIIADYDSHPNKIIYDNLKGYAISRGVSLNIDVDFNNGLTFLVGATAMDVYQVNNSVRTLQLLTERYSGVWTVGYMFKKIGLSVNYTGNLYGPMRLPLLNALDPRAAFSPWWSIQNIQLTKIFSERFEIYGGIKNLLNWTPNKGSPFIIARSRDPFDKEVTFDANGQAVPTDNNPYALTFDPTYMYAPNQGIRAFLGLRYNFNK